MANYLAPEDDPVNFLPARVNPNLAAQGRRYNLTERQQINPLMQAGAEQWVKEFASMKNRGAVPDLINRGLIANTAGLPVDLVNTVLQSLGLGSEQPVGGSDSIRRALEYYGLSSETQRPMLETLASLTPPRAVMGAARVAGQGAEALGRAAAPVAGQALENYMVRTGGILPMTVYHGSPHRFPPTAKNPLGEFDASKIGTGEGAQAYGQGLYFAENPAVAQDYARVLTKNAAFEGKPVYEIDTATMGRRQTEVRGQTIIGRDARGPLPGSWRVKELADEYKGPIAALKDLIDKGLVPKKSTKWIDPDSGNINVSSVAPNLYKVDLPDEQIAKMLDWDKPLTTTPNGRAALDGLMPKLDKESAQLLKQDAARLDGSGLVTWAQRVYGKDGASAYLQSHGIPGIRYLDEGSRAAGEGTSNFVVFDPAHMNIIGRE